MLKNVLFRELGNTDPSPLFSALCSRTRTPPRTAKERREGKL